MLAQYLLWKMFNLCDTQVYKLHVFIEHVLNSFSSKSWPQHLWPFFLDHLLSGLILGRIRSHGSEHCQLNLPNSSCFPQLPTAPGVSHLHHRVHPQSEKSIRFDIISSLVQPVLMNYNFDVTWSWGIQIWKRIKLDSNILEVFASS